MLLRVALSDLMLRRRQRLLVPLKQVLEEDVTEAGEE
jgi:hypothetical protein